MNLSPLTIDSIKEYISGDHPSTPYLSGPEILKLFNHVGFKDIYDRENGGMPEGVSRNKYVFDKLKQINGTKEIIALFQMVFDPRHFARDPKLDLNEAVDSFNKLILQDGYRLEPFDGRYKIIGADLPEAVEVEVHFEEIQQQIAEQLQNARFTIWIAVAWFTDPVLFEILLRKKVEGINVRIIVYDDEINAKYGLPYEANFETVKIKPKGAYNNIMHHKFCVIDMRVVIHGSYNWTNKARWNKETITVDSSRELAERFSTEFISLLQKK